MGDAMKHTLVIVLAAAVALLGTATAWSGDFDARSLEAKLADQEARLRELQDKANSNSAYGAPAEQSLSLDKNARVTIGGTVSTRITSQDASIGR